MSSANVAIVQNIFAALSEGDLAKAAAYFDPKIRIYEPANLPYGGLYIGHEGFYQLFERLSETFDNLTIPPSAIADAGLSVIAMTTLQGITRQSGIQVSMPLNEVFVVRQGKVTEIRPFYWDSAAIVSAIAGNEVNHAIIPEPWQAVLNR
jgi:uncharacterized protein